MAWKKEVVGKCRMKTDTYRKKLHEKWGPHGPYKMENRPTMRWLLVDTIDIGST